MSLNWQKLPHEVLYKIFSYLDRSSLVKCASLCQSWYASAGDELLWKRLLLSTFRLPSSTVIRNDKYSWKSELKRLIDEVPSVLVQDLTLHRDEVLHVNFSHDGSELVSCSKDNTFIVWTDKTEENDGKFRSIYYKDMLKYEWNHTWASQFSPDDSKLMVSGVVSAIRGEIAIFNTGREKNDAEREGNYQLLSRVVNDPYDWLGCWLTSEFFISASFLNLDDNIAFWLCRSNQEDEESQEYISLKTPTKVIFKFHNPAIYGRFVQVHSRKSFYCPIDAWRQNPTDSHDANQDRGHQQLENEPDFDEDGLNLPLPLLNVDLTVEAKEVLDEEMCLVFICSSQTFIPHQIGFQRISHRCLSSNPIVQNGAEKIIDMHGHIVGIGISPDHRELYVNVRSWPENCKPSLEDPPCISNQIEMKVIDLETFSLKGRSLMGHLGYTPSENAFYLYLDISDELVASGSEDKKGYIFDRHYKCNTAKLEHQQCVNCVAFRPSAASSSTTMCATASDDFTIKLWQSRQSLRDKPR